MTHDSALHLTEAELHDAADGGAAPAASHIARHLGGCVHCRSEVDRIAGLLARAASLPKAIEPPADLWPGVSARIRQQHSSSADSRTPSLATSSPTSPRQPDATSRQPDRLPSRWQRFVRDGRSLAAAAIVLVVASSALTLVLSGPASDDTARAPVSLDSSMPVTERSVVRTVNDDYTRLDRELAALFAAQRELLQPETVAKVERNLAIIDAAIAEIREAMLADPGNEALRALLEASYGQKAAIVRQVSAS